MLLDPVAVYIVAVVAAASAAAALSAWLCCLYDALDAALKNDRNDALHALEMH
jgi:hypothetical protein